MTPGDAAVREARQLIGARRPALGADPLEIRDPGNGDLVGLGARGSADDVAAAVAAARAAQPAWAATPLGARGELLRRAAEMLAAQRGAWARLITREMGKPLRESLAECDRAVAIVRYYAAEAQRPFGAQYASQETPAWIFTRREPVGVVGVIAPWNHPGAIPTWKSVPALLYGNAVVLKLAEQAPLSGLVLVDTLREAGLPDGVVNVVLGVGETVGAALAAHPGLDVISFTGSTAVGERIRAAAGVSGARAQLELGGSNAAIVRADADVELAVGALHAGAFATSGQNCTATRRVYVARERYDEVAERLVARARAMPVGHGLDDGVELGPLIDRAARDRVLAACRRAEAAGTVLLAAEEQRDGRLAAGAFVGPALVGDLPHDAELARDEVFGPALALWPVDSDEQALALANRSRYGLSASIFTRDLDVAKQFVERIEAGVVRVNQKTSGVEPHVPFGGWKASGHGPREQGRAPLELLTREKTVYIHPSA
ncbi:MAG TPA: aldehyde dehydrogenase family protein [Conexibacter sp.]|nr:aldehyde dehydrogenase family protein [Conexibacter sp.]